MNLSDQPVPTRRRRLPVSAHKRQRTGASCLAFLLLCLLALNGCGTPASSNGSTSAGKVLNVVATINFWGSIAQQLGGAHVAVISVVTSPTGDPHNYEPTTSDSHRRLCD